MSTLVSWLHTGPATCLVIWTDDADALHVTTAAEEVDDGCIQIVHVDGVAMPDDLCREVADQAHQIATQDSAREHGRLIAVDAEHYLGRAAA